MTGNDVRLLRERLGLTPQQLAELLGTAVSTVYRWETAGPKEISIDPFQVRILALLREQIAPPGSAPRNDIATAITRGLLIGGGLLGLYYLLDSVFGTTGGGAREGTATPRRRAARSRKASSTARRKGGGKR